MKTTVHKSIFNLIEIFSFNQSKAPITVSSKKHCEQKYHHDFYCDAEKPFVSKF
ncbi:hypothetical protein [Croceivirga lutea]|uniref:hypothetical protein n=1 Tax=Croceivirga lutea TaxID=1775167 RepID=UPI00163A2EB7|nr:hypothetical protein [Croceivirga lutea]